MRIGVKIGSSLLTKEGNGINYPFMIDLCRQISQLSKSGDQVFLVTSGAIKSDPAVNRSNNLRAAIGMPRLMAKYIEYLGIYGIEAAQMLVVDWDFERNGDFIKTVIEEALAQQVVPIFNANDVVSNDEIENLAYLADNDHLFLRLCQLLKPTVAIMGIDQPGIMHGPGDKEKIGLVGPWNFQSLYNHVTGGHVHTAGQDGAKIKMIVGREIAEMGIKFILAPGQEKDFVLRAFDFLIGNDGYKSIGTVFVFNQ